MRYHVPRDGFVWHSDSGPKKRLPTLAWPFLFAGACFVAGIVSARVWSPSVPIASSAVISAPSPSPSKLAIAPLQPRVWTEPTDFQQVAVGGHGVAPQAPPAAAVAPPQVKLINPDADEASIDPSMVTPQAVPVRPKAERPRAPRAEPAPRLERAAPIAPQAGPQGSTGYSALREQLFDRAP